MKRSAILSGIAVTMLLSSPFAQAELDRLVLAVPARHMLVNLAFDLADMHPQDLDIVCYSQAATEEGIHLECFDRVSWRWRTLDMETWQHQGTFRPGARRMVLVGNDATAQRLRVTSWATRIQQADGTQPHEVANAVHRELRLSRPQWQRLAKTHGFKLEDRNVERRRYGRYGPPGGPRASRERPTPEPLRITIPANEQVVVPLEPETHQEIETPVKIEIEAPIRAESRATDSPRPAPPPEDAKTATEAAFDQVAEDADGPAPTVEVVETVIAPADK